MLKVHNDGENRWLLTTSFYYDHEHIIFELLQPEYNLKVIFLIQYRTDHLTQE